MRTLTLTRLSFMAMLVLSVIFTAAAPRFAYAQQPQTGGLVLKSHRVTVDITDQIAMTKIEQVFYNGGQGLAEGTYLFPLPAGAAVSDLTLYIDGVAYKPQLLNAAQAQDIYTAIVRQRRDPVLLQYVGRDAIQANIFPIPAGQERKIDITYSNIISGDNGVFNYLYPLKTDYVSAMSAQQVSLAVNLTSKDPISTVYSPNPQVIVTRIDDHNVRAGFEVTNYRAVDDFALYYGLANAEISANLITYRAGSNEDGYFMLMLTPPTNVANDRIIPKDVIIVLDQSGSMQGEKWTQAQAAARYVLTHLNPQDRFNAIVFSTGYRQFANTMQSVSEAPNAAQWISSLDAVGGTDINLALTTAAQLADPERQTVLLFLTDGLPSEGVVESKSIIANIAAVARPNLRLFSFGVGDDVDTFLLDSLSTAYGGTSVYVRPQENIEQKVSSLYNKITSPVLTNLRLDFGSVMVDDSYPLAPLPDLFAGSSLIVVGRYRGGDMTSIKLAGNLNGQPQTFTYDRLVFPTNAGGQPFVPRLWATRKIGYVLNQIRLNGETKELVDSVVALSIRYGIITPYTSFLIQEDQPPVVDNIVGTPAPLGTPMPPMEQASAPSDTSGAAAVDRASEANDMASAGAVAAAPTAQAKTGNGEVGATTEVIKLINDRTFILRGGVWLDTQYTAAITQVIQIEFLSNDYFRLLELHPELKDYLAIGDHIIVVVDGIAYEIKP